MSFLIEKSPTYIISVIQIYVKCIRKKSIEKARFGKHLKQRIECRFRGHKKEGTKSTQLLFISHKENFQTKK